LRTQVNPSIAEVRRNLEASNHLFDMKLLAERDVLASRFSKEQEDLSERFKAAENEIKGTINGYVEDIKTNFAHELKQKLVVHKRNMIEAVETKCFELDKELDHIKQAL
jgi:hypothetical protein